MSLLEPVYRLAHVTKRYGSRTILDIADFSVARGETLALIGPSGAGKSTLLRLLAFIEPPTTGDICYAGHPVNGAVPLSIRRQVTMVFQRPELLDSSVERNVAFGLGVRGKTDRQAVLAALDHVGLLPLATARARGLSGGEQQRVALARALVVQPRVLLLDEPTAHLDPHNVAIIEAAIAALKETAGTTVVLATHNLHQARRLAGRTALLLDGRIVEAGPTAALLSAPADPRTRAFVSGEMVY